MANLGFDRWYLTHAGRNLGPLSAAQLLDLLSSNQVAAHEIVWPEGVDVGITVQRFLEKVRAETVPGWMAEFPCAPFAKPAEGWYHMPQQERRGPFAPESLIELAARGELRPEDVLWRHDANGWTAFKAKNVVSFPPPGNPWPSWVKDIARIENLNLPTPRPAAQVPTWLEEAKQTELATDQHGKPPVAPASPRAAALPDWMTDAMVKPMPSSPAPVPPPPPTAASGVTPDWLNDIRQIEESLRRRLVQALAATQAARPSAVPAPPAVQKPAATAPRPVTAGASAARTAERHAWPLSHDYNEVIQNPAQCFADPELRQGVAVTNALGLPVPCSGSFADVYALQTPSRKLAVKCFTHRIPGLQERYVEISKHLKQVQVPFIVDFEFLEQGIRVRDQWYPVVKMQWVEGLPLNTYVRDQLGSPETLQTLCRMWVRLASRLRKADLAHGDLQHGNVLLMPGARTGTFRVRLVDYDGMCVPALDLLKPIEVGHPGYQHPQRRRDGTYGLEIDRFSHLVIYTALRSLTVGGRNLWDKYDNGDNLLFTQKDFENPQGSALFQELRQLSDPGAKGLIEALAMACQKPLEQTPPLEEVVSTTLGKASGGEESSYTILSVDSGQKK